MHHFFSFLFLRIMLVSAFFYTCVPPPFFFFFFWSRHHWFSWDGDKQVLYHKKSKHLTLTIAPFFFFLRIMLVSAQVVPQGITLFLHVIIDDLSDFRPRLIFYIFFWETDFRPRLATRFFLHSQPFLLHHFGTISWRKAFAETWHQAQQILTQT